MKFFRDITPQNNTNTFNTSIIVNVSVSDQFNNISSCLLEWNYTSNETIFHEMVFILV